MITLRSKMKNLELISVTDIASILKVSTKTVYNHIDKGQIPQSLIIRLGNQIRMKQQDLEKYIEENKGRIRELSKE